MFAYLELIDRDANKQRYYMVDVCQNMFGDWQVDRRWGRIGETATDASTLHLGRSEALRFAYAVLFSKLERGYLRVRFEETDSNVSRFVPRRSYAYLNMKLAEFFRTKKRFHGLVSRMYDFDILYVGELVQLAEADVLYFARLTRTGPKVYDEHVEEFMGELTAYLGDYGLQMCASIVGWKRPDRGTHDYELVSKRLIK